MRDDVRAQERLQLRNRLQPVHEEVGEHRQLMCADEIRGRLGEQRQRPRAGVVGVPRQRGLRRFDGELGDVGGQQEVPGPLLLAHLREHTVDLAGGGRGRQIGLRAGDFTRHPQEALEVAIAEGMVDDPPGRLGVLRGGADHVDHGDVLGIAAGDGVRRRQLADAERREERRHAAQAPVAIGRVAGVQLVGVADPADAVVRDHVVEQLQVEVSRYAEHLGDAEFGEAVQQVVADGVVRCSLHGFSHPTKVRLSNARLGCAREHACARRFSARPSRGPASDPRH